MFGLGNIFNKDKNGKGIDRNQVFALMQDPKVRKLIGELQSRLSKEEQKELMELAKKGDFDGLTSYLREKVPDWDNLVKGAWLV